MGCLIEFLVELLLEGWLELMQSFIPEKGLPKWVRYVLSLVVALISCASFLMFFIGMVAWITGEKFGITLVLISLLIGFAQIGLGILSQHILHKRKGLQKSHFEATIVYIDKDVSTPLTTVLCDVQKGELQQGDIVLLLNEEGFSLGIGAVHSIIHGRKDVAQIRKGFFSLSVKILLYDVHDKPIDKAVSVIKQ